MILLVVGFYQGCDPSHGSGALDVVDKLFPWLCNLMLVPLRQSNKVWAKFHALQVPTVALVVGMNNNKCFRVKEDLLERAMTKE